METAENLCLDFGCRRKRAFLQRAHWEEKHPAGKLQIPRTSSQRATLFTPIARKRLQRQ